MITKEFNGFKLIVRPGTCDEKVADHNLVRQVFLQNLPEYKSQPDDVVVDVGAHIGAFSILLASKIPHGRVFALEPEKDTYQILKRNIDLQGAKNIQADKVALAGRDGQAELFHDQESWGHSTTKDFQGGSEKVPAVSLATYFEQNRIDQCALVKINCEGAEFDIIKNTPPDVLRKVKVWLILFHLDLSPGHNADEIRNKLTDCGFRVQDRCRGDERGWIVADKS